jgi:hypothetical protein
MIHSQEKQKGFVTLMIVGLMPILLSALSIYYLSTTWVHIDFHVFQLCRSELLKSTSSAAQDLTWLMEKNPESTQLQIDKQQLEAEMSAAPDPITRSILRARLQIVKTRQYALNIQQKSRITKANATLKSGMIQANQQVQNYFNNYLRRFPFFFRFENLKTSQQNPSLQVRPTTQHTAPNYGTLPNLRTAQNQVLIWSYTLHTQPWLVRLGFHQKYEFQQSCEASILELNGGSQCKSVLTKARY